MTMSTVSFEPSAPVKTTKTAPRRSGTLPPPPPRPWVVRLAGVLVVGGLVWLIGLVVSGETGSELHAPGGWATFLGTATGLVGTYLALVMVLLASRIPPVERVLGQDGLLRWHRRISAWPILLILLHAVLITVGYAQAAHSGFGHEIGVLLNDYQDVLAATVGLGLMLLIGVLSVRAIRRRLRRETWWAIHLYIYLALALSFAHALVLGPTFVGHPLTQAIWSLVWAGAAGLVVVYRIGLPVVRTLRHDIRVVEVRPEGPGVVSVICKGRNLDRLPVAGGQFVMWRFLVRDLWWQAHPYTLSSMPRPPYLRITVKAVGDHSEAVASLRPGTRVAIEGPYGAFTRYSRRYHRVAMIAAGIGVTAVRSLLEDLPSGTEPIVLIRATTEEDLVLRREIAALVRHHKGKLHELVGRRDEVRVDSATLRRLVPDLARRDVYVCGPESFVDTVDLTCRHLGVHRSSLHHEAYAL
ncbi:MAG: ferredoxin reductase family protein [Actinomycetota bacterium]|jgi:predicted ferric reductase|nr:ferredoxin reductase family protein [Actinomycetota bacterium]